MVVWDPEGGYNANIKKYPTNLGSPSFNLPNVDHLKNEASRKMIDVFNREREEIIERMKKLQREYDDSIMVWESKISFEPIVGKIYYLYNFKGTNTLSLISPEEWGKKDCFLGTFMLDSDRKWIRII